MSPTQKPVHLFLSYASEGFVAVEVLYHRLCRAPYEPWLDRKNIIAGEDLLAVT